MARIPCRAAALRRTALFRAAAVVVILAWSGVRPASATTITFESALSPEVLGATGSGTVTIVYDDVAQTLEIDATFSGLSGDTTVAHIHCCTAVPFTGTIGVAVTPGTLPGFPVGVMSGTYNVLLDLTSPATYTAGFLSGFGGGTVGGAELALIAGLTDGTAYFNVHSTTFPGGEIRGFPQPVPEPSTLLLLGSGAAAAAWRRRRRAGA